MPIQTPVQPIRPTKAQFTELDYLLMGEAFKIHNKFGRLLDETIYQKLMVEACKASGLTAIDEVPVHIVHKSFRKTYYIDLLVENSTVFELKTATSISESHKSQTLQYLLLCDLPHGKIINFRPSTVESYFVSTTLQSIDRRDFQVTTDQWFPRSPNCERIPDHTTELLKDIGTHLDISLYREALIHLLRSEAELKAEVTFHLDGLPVGKQPANLIAPGVMLHTTSLRRDIDAYRTQLNRLLNNSDLEAIQWINFGGSDIQCITLKN